MKQSQEENRKDQLSNRKIRLDMYKPIKNHTVKHTLLPPVVVVEVRLGMGEVARVRSAMVSRRWGCVRESLRG